MLGDVGGVVPKGLEGQQEDQTKGWNGQGWGDDWSAEQVHGEVKRG